MLVRETLAALALETGGYYVDATFGRGGHTALILQAVGREGRVLALDRDPQAIAAGAVRFPDEMRLALVHASFADLGTLVPAFQKRHPSRTSASDDMGERWDFDDKDEVRRRLPKLAARYVDKKPGKKK